MAHVSIVPMIDRSGTMQYYSYIEPAKTDAATFVSIMKDADQLGIVAFSTESQIIFPLQTVNDNVIRNAISTINAIQTINLTNIKEAIQQAHQMLVLASNPNKAMILLSDGLWNEGGDPLPTLPTDIPIHTIALGRNGQLDFLNTVAVRTNGAYHFSPDAFDLAEIYNEIAGRSHIAEVSINQKQQIPSDHFNPIPMNVPAGTDKVDIAVNWLDTSIKYTDQTPGPNQVNVTIRDPNNQRYTNPPDFTGNGFVVFRIRNPIPGQWMTACWCGNIGANVFKGTTGVFEPDSLLTMDLQTPGLSINKSEPVNVKARVSYKGKSLTNIVVDASVESPLNSEEEIKQTYSGALKRITPDENLIKKGMSEEKCRLVTLHKQLLPQIDIFARTLSPLEAKVDKSSGSVDIPLNLALAGSHTIKVKVTGTLPDNSVFTRVRRLSVMAN